MSKLGLQGPVAARAAPAPAEQIPGRAGPRPGDDRHGHFDFSPPLLSLFFFPPSFIPLFFFSCSFSPHYLGRVNSRVITLFSDGPSITAFTSPIPTYARRVLFYLVPVAYRMPIGPAIRCCIQIGASGIVTAKQDPLLYGAVPAKQLADFAAAFRERFPIAGFVQALVCDINRTRGTICS